MLRLFAIENSCFNDDEKFEKYLALADCARRGKIQKLSVRERRNQSLAAGVILPLALQRSGYFGKFKLEYGKYGKPCLAEPEGLYFNLSHSGEWTVLALSDCEVGCDIQRVKLADIRLAERFFAADEIESVRQAGDSANDLFFRLWTVKESYLKALGTGFSRPMNSFSVTFSVCGVSVCDPLSVNEWSVVEVAGPEGYKIACCTAQPSATPKFEIISL